MRAVGQRAQRRRPCAQLVGTDRSGPARAARPGRPGSLPASQRLRMRAFSTGASLRGLVPMIRQRIRLLDAGDAGVEGIEVAARGIERRAILAAFEIRLSQAPPSGPSARTCLGIAQIAGDGADALARNARAASRRWRRRPRPRSPAAACRRAASRADPAAGASAHRRRSGDWSADPLLVHVVIECAAGCAAPRGPRASMRMLVPTASSTSMLSVFVSSQGRETKA